MDAPRDQQLFKTVESLLARVRTLCEISYEYSDVNDFIGQHGEDLRALTKNLDAILPFWASMARSAGVSAEICGAVIAQVSRIKQRLATTDNTSH